MRHVNNSSHIAPTFEEKGLETYRNHLCSYLVTVVGLRFVSKFVQVFLHLCSIPSIRTLCNPHIVCVYIYISHGLRGRCTARAVQPSRNERSGQTNGLAKPATDLISLAATKSLRRERA